MTGAWAERSLGEVLVQREEVVAIDPAGEYPLAGVRAFGRGMFASHVLAGTDTSYRELYRFRAGDLVLSRVKGWEGAVAVVPDELDGSYGSREFPAFTARGDRVDTRYLEYWFRSAAGMAALRRGAAGLGARRERLREREFLAIRARFPARGEQARVVARLDGLFSRLVQVGVESSRQIEDVNAALTGAVVGSPPCMHPRVPVRSALRRCAEEVSVIPGRSYRFAGIRSFGQGMFDAGSKVAGEDFSYGRLIRLGAGNLVFPKLMAWEGAFAVVPDALAGSFVSPEFVQYAPTGLVSGDVLDVWFRSDRCLPEVRARSSGTNMRRRRLMPDAFETLSLPCPDARAGELVRRIYAARREVEARHAVRVRDVEALGKQVLEQVFAPGA